MASYLSTAIWLTGSVCFGVVGGDSEIRPATEDEWKRAVAAFDLYVRNLSELTLHFSWDATKTNGAVTGRLEMSATGQRLCVERLKAGAVQSK